MNNVAELNTFAAANSVIFDLNKLKYSLSGDTHVVDNVTMNAETFQVMFDQFEIDDSELCDRLFTVVNNFMLLELNDYANAYTVEITVYDVDDILTIQSLSSSAKLERVQGMRLEVFKTRADAKQRYLYLIDQLSN